MRTKSYIAFMLNNEEYGIELSYAQEILRLPSHITQLPNMPQYVEGVINIRGKVIPVIDLKKRFDIELTESSDDSRLLILDLKETVIAVIIDDVSDILNIEEDQIQSLNSTMSQIGQNSLTGIANIDNKLILLLDVFRLKTDIFTYRLEMEELK